MLGSRVSQLPNSWLLRCLPVALALSTPTFALRAAAQEQQTPPLSQEFDLLSYEAELDRYAAEIKHADAIPQLRKSLPHIWFVRTPDSRRMDVSTMWLAQRLEKLEKEPDSKAVIGEVTMRLAAMRESAMDMEATSQQPSAEDARKRYDQIMRRSEFAGERGPGQWDRLGDRIGRWMTDQILRLMRALHLGGATGNVVAWTVVGLAFLALAYFVYRNLAGRSQLQEPSVETLADLSDSRQWARDALAAAERGDYREAVHCAYWTAIARAESLRLLDPHPSEQKLLREFTRHFELIWYGYRPASVQDWSDARAHLEKMGCLPPSTLATANS
jgi:hypothetical protein